MKIICLANSYKHKGRCIAGIDLQSGRWIRPISDLESGKISEDNPHINVKNIQLLDIVDIPINSTEKLGHEIENYRYHNDFWQVMDKAKITDLFPHCESSLLYPEFERCIPFNYFEHQSSVRTLQLIEVKSLYCYRNGYGKPKVRILDKEYGISDVELSITDPIILERLNDQHSFTCHGLVCLSFAQPWRKYEWEELMCYRLVAGVVEIFPELEVILMEMERIGWNYHKGKQYLRHHFNKESRYQLTQVQAQHFLEYLKNQPDAERK